MLLSKSENDDRLVDALRSELDGVKKKLRAFAAEQQSSAQQQLAEKEVCSVLPRTAL